MISVVLIAIVTVHLGHGYFAQNNGQELGILYLTVALAIVFTGRAFTGPHDWSRLRLPARCHVDYTCGRRFLERLQTCPSDALFNRQPSALTMSPRFPAETNLETDSEGYYDEPRQSFIYRIIPQIKLWSFSICRNSRWNAHVVRRPFGHVCRR